MTLHGTDIPLWLQVIRSPQIGVRTFWKIHLRSKNTDEFLENAQRYLSSKGEQLIKKEAVQKEIDFCDQNNLHLIDYNSPLYPSSLKVIADPPPVLTIKGDIKTLCNHMLAVVGGRNASLAGQQMSHELSLMASNHGLCVVSGLARGIDSFAHSGCLKGKSPTLAVVAGGVDQLYPKENQKLYVKICEKGAILSEMPCGMSPSATHFPKRNRLISGLSQGVVVIEAAKASGTLITARCALEQSKDVFVVPGSPLDPRYHGSNDLLKNGAILTTDFNDILDAFNWKHPKSAYTQESTPPTLSLEEPTRTFLPFNHGPEKTDDLKEHLLSSLSSVPVGLDELMMKHQAPLKELSNSLFFLELEGKIKKLPGGKYVCL